MNGLDSFQPTGFLAAALDRARRLTDAPREFHIFSTFAVLGAAASGLRITHGTSSFSPALWIVLVAPSAFYRKSTSLKIARDLLVAARPGLAPPPYYSGSILHALRAPGKLHLVDDFSSLLPLVVAQRLVELHDTDAPLSLLVSASSHTLSARLAATDVTAGLLSRFAFVLPPEKDNWLSSPGSPRPEKDAPLVEYLKAVTHLSARVSFAECKAEFRAWGEKAASFVNRFSGSVHQALAAGFSARLQPALYKLAALVEISRYSTPDELNAAVTGTTLSVTPPSFEAASQLTSFLRLSFGCLIEGELRRARELNDEVRIMSMLMRAPGITRRQVLQNSGIPAEALDPILDALKNSGSLRSNGSNLYVSPSRWNGSPTPETGQPTES